MVPDTPKTLSQGELKFSYQLASANTFIDTIEANNYVHLSRDKIREGLEESDFFFTPHNKPYPGFNAYIDVETNRHLFKILIGLPLTMEFGIEWPLLSFGPGFLDYPIERFHDVVGVDNNEEKGGFRIRSDRDRFDFYLIRSDRFILKERTSFYLKPGDPVFRWKWSIYSGTNWLPSVALKLAYKHPLDDARSYPRRLISSGEPDYGVYYILSKSFLKNQWFAYLQGGRTSLTIKDDGFIDHIDHTLFTLEYQEIPERSWLAQWAQQSSVFSGNPPTPTGDTVDFSQIDRGFATPTDVLTLGVKQVIDSWIYSVGIIEDINQTRNAIDFGWIFTIEWNT